MRKHRILLIGLAFFLAFSLWDIPHVLAQGKTYEDFIPSEEALRNGTLISNILEAINVLAWIAFDLIDTLLDPAFIFNDLGGGATASPIYAMLNSIWVLSRNLMNIVFAVVLVLAAIYTTMKADLSIVKENMGRFVLAVVLVNFSWLFPLMVIDAANIMTSFVYGLPNELPGRVACVTPDQNGGTKPCELIDDVVYFPVDGARDQNKNPRPVSATDDCRDASGHSSPQSIPVAERCGYDCHLGMVCIKRMPITASTPSYRGVVHGLVFNYAHLGDIARLPATAPVSTSNIRLWLTFVIRQLVAIVIMVALAFPLMALALAFLMRIPILWVTIAFMPFFFMGWVLEGKIPGVEKTKGILDEFIKAAFLPVITALPLTIGFIMMNALAANGAMLNALQGRLSSSAPLAGSIADFFDIFWMCMALGIMWKGTFMALESGGMAGQFGGWFKGMGEAIGKIGVLVPLQIPFPAGKGKTKGGIWGAAQQLNPKRWAAALQYSTGLEDAVKQVRGGTSTVSQDLNAKQAKQISDHVDAALAQKDKITTDPAAFRDAFKPIKDVLEELGVNVNDNDAVARALDNLANNANLSGKKQQILELKNVIQPPAPQQAATAAQPAQNP